MSIGRIALIFLLAQLAPPQPQRTGTASVEGVIVRLGTNEPISGVDLELTDTIPTGPPAGSTVASTPVPFAAKSGSDGRFAIRNLPSGTYKLVAARIGGLFVPVEYGQRGVLGRGVSFPLGEGQQMRDIRLPQTTTDANGRFDLNGVTPGSYQLYFLGAQTPGVRPAPGVPPPPPPPPLMTMTAVEVGNEDIENINVTINLGSTITARATIEGRQDGDPDVAKLRVNVDAVPSGVALVSSVGGQVAANGIVTIPNVWPADYRLTVQGIPPNTYVKSIRLGQLDLLADVFRIPTQVSGQVEIVIGADAATIEGKVVNDRQETSANVKVALVPDGPSRRRGDLYKSTVTDGKGGFRITGVAPGDYKIFAWEEADDGAWRSPEYLRQDESRGKPVRVSALRTENVSVVVVPARR
jgi:hypothetical protein